LIGQAGIRELGLSGGLWFFHSQRHKKNAKVTKAPGSSIREPSSRLADHVLKDY